MNTYPHLAEAGFGGNPDATADGDLAAAATTIVGEWNAAEPVALRERLELRASQGRASTDIVDVARAATHGTVEAVFVDIDEVVPGRIDETPGAVTFGTADTAAGYGVVDEIARRAFLTGARILAVRRGDIPGNGSVAAFLRFAI